MVKKLRQLPQNISLYFHVPFCTQKCHYCHFYVLPDKLDLKNQLLGSLKLEWERWQNRINGNMIKTIYFGGGTPALFGPERIHEMLNTIKSSFSLDQVEITLEANPEDITQKLMEAYRQAGINRVSIGIQSLDNRLLEILSRKHSSEKAIESVHLTSLAGINNISIDLMFDLPNQTLEHWENTLQQAINLPISHLSLYNLTIEPHTVFFKYRDSLKKQMPEEEISTKMYLMAIERLQQADLMQYEISAFAKNGFHSIHNTGYWTGRPFLGFGPSAFSYWQGKRFRNIANLSRYAKALQENQTTVDFEEELSQDAMTRELMIINLRMVKGCDLQKYSLDETTLKTLQRLIEEGFIFREGTKIHLTQKGILFYDTVASELV